MCVCVYGFAGFALNYDCLPKVGNLSDECS